jgi:membrane associated rhomboid family serine protease
MAVCYRHPDRETGVSCSNCGRPICTNCMTTTPVGMRCPECAKQKTQVRTLRNSAHRPVVTMTLIALNVLIYFGGSTRAGFLADYGLYGPAVANGDWWRLLTAGFLHGGLLHIGFNMYILWYLGNLVEGELGPVRFAALYFASLLAGSFGALLFSPTSLTVGASGAVFGLMGATFVMQRARGIDPMQGGIGPLILLNLAIGFLPGLNISIGGHVGGLIGGALAGYAIDQLQRRRIGGLVAPILVCLAVGALAVAASLARVSGYA